MDTAAKVTGEGGVKIIVTTYSSFVFEVRIRLEMEISTIVPLAATGSKDSMMIMSTFMEELEFSFLFLLRGL